MRQLILICFAVLVAVGARAESTLERRYSFDKLEGFWSATLGATPPDAAPYERLVEGDEPPAAVTPAPVDFGLPQIGEIIGESAEENGQITRLGFPVIPLDEGEAATMMRRLAWAELYLTRYRFYVAASTDPSDAVARMAGRQIAAGLETYLVNARLYYAAPDMQEKCTRLMRLQTLATGALAAIGQVAVPADWARLAEIQHELGPALDAVPLATLVCSVEPVRGQRETRRIVITRVRELLAAAAREKVDETLVLLDAAAEEFQTLVNNMDVEIKTAEILDLERRFGNAAANLELVKTDQLRADMTIQELEAVDLSALSRPGDLEDLTNAEGLITDMAGRIDVVLDSLSALGDLTPISGTGAALSACSALRDLYEDLDLDRDSAVLSAEIVGPYEDCLTRTRAAVTEANTPNLQTVLAAELAHHVRRLSENFFTGTQ